MYVQKEEDEKVQWTTINR